MKAKQGKVYSNEFYRAALMVTAVGATSLGGFCGCGTDAEWGLVYHLLRAMDGRVEEPDECIREYMRPSDSPAYWGNSTHSPYNHWGFPHEPVPEFFAKFLDSGRLTEHGTTVVWAWLTDKGRAYLDAMDVCIEEYCRVNDLDEERFREGPFDFSTFNAAGWWGGCDDDDIYMPDWVFKLEQYLVTNEGVACRVAYMLFTGDEDKRYNDNEAYFEQVSTMLNEIKRLMEEEE